MLYKSSICDQSCFENLAILIVEYASQSQIFLFLIVVQKVIQRSYIYCCAMNKKVAQKWQARKQKKEETNDSPASINFSFKTHQISQSEAQIIIPSTYTQFNKPSQIIIIEIGKEKVLAQTPKFKINEASCQQVEEKNQISVLKTLLDINRVQCGSSGTLRGQINYLPTVKEHEYRLEFVQFLVRETYFSRRDQYKVIRALKEAKTHIFLRKALYFDEISLQVRSMMKANQIIVNDGIIDKHTQLIFRTSCSKLTVGVEISIQTFQLNEKKELYLQKMVEFLEVYLQRSIFFNTTHRLTLFFYGRCFYPQFSTLEAAYTKLQKENTILGENEKFQKNFAVALQKDYRGRIYQDVYRRIIWSSDDVDSFREFFWDKINQFLFTLNWDLSSNQHGIAKFIKESLEKKMLGLNKQGLNSSLDSTSQSMKIRPFVHKLKCQLAKSKDSNLFEAISLISEQYRHHYKFRTLTETGNTVILLSAGKLQYETDLTTYKMAKSYVYLTNVNVSCVNFANKTSKQIKVELVNLIDNPIFTVEQASKYKQLSLYCIEKQIYLSPTKEDLEIRGCFYSKNCIYPHEFKLVDEQKSKQLKKLHRCDNEQHYQLLEDELEPLQYKKKVKEVKHKNVSFINVYSFDDKVLHTHKELYKKIKIKERHLPTINSNKIKNSEFDIFQANLDKIIVTKLEWGLEYQENQINKRLQNYRDLTNPSKKSDKKEKQSGAERTAKIIFRESNYVEQNNHQSKFQTTSIPGISVPHTPYDSRSAKKRNTSEIFYCAGSQKEYSEESMGKGKVNIFQKTFNSKNHEYVAGQKEESKMKKNSSHNKQRLKDQHSQSSIHYFMPSYNDQALKKLKAFIKSEYIEELKDEEENIIFLFETEKMWKNLTFPLLTPINTKYKQKFKNQKEYIGSAVTNETNNKNSIFLEDEICNLLMKNFQIQESDTNLNHSNMTINLSKGQVCCLLKINGPNLTRFYNVDLDKQQRIIPNLFYRYLSYEDKDCRFCSKYIYFKDKNYFPEGKKLQLETKIIKIALCSTEAVLQEKIMNENDVKEGDNSNTTKKDHFQDFIRMFNQKYKEIAIDLTYKLPHIPPKKKKQILNFSKNQKRVLYHHQQIQIDIDTEYNHFDSFEILVSWNLCSSVIIKQFVDNVMTMGRRSKLHPALLSSGNIFNTVWSVTTIGEVIIKNKTGFSLLEGSIGKSGEWLWDSQDYYFHISGISFIKFVRQKNMVLWRDNNHEKRSRDIKKQDSAQQYVKFFLKAAVMQFIGEMIEEAYTTVIKKI